MQIFCKREPILSLVLFILFIITIQQIIYVIFLLPCWHPTKKFMMNIFVSIIMEKFKYIYRKWRAKRHKKLFYLLMYFKHILFTNVYTHCILLSIIWTGFQFPKHIATKISLIKTSLIFGKASWSAFSYKRKLFITSSISHSLIFFL